LYKGGKKIERMPISRKEEAFQYFKRGGKERKEGGKVKSALIPLGKKRKEKPLTNTNLKERERKKTIKRKGR